MTNMNWKFLLLILSKGYDYSRSGNPTRECFEQCIASIDGAKYGRFSFVI